MLSGESALQEAVPSAILLLLIEAYNNAQDIQLVWIPLHVGHKHHDHIDNLAINACLLPAPITKLGLP